LLLLAGIVATGREARRARKAEAVAGEKAEALREELTKSHVARARIAVQRGELNEALESYKQALAGGHPESAKVRLDLAQAHAALYQYPEAANLLDRVLEDDSARGLHPSALLLKSYTTLGPKLNEGLEGVRKALALGLSKSEAAFARGLL